MKILLDTHILIWFLEDNPRLDKTMRSQILEAEEAFVSIASIWECAIKVGLKRINLDIAELIKELDVLNIAVLAIKPEHVVALTTLPLIHRDPFDRILIAQALSEPLILLTEDRKIKGYF